MTQDASSGKPVAHHGGRFSEGMLDVKRIMETLDIRPGLTVIDAGCGNGHMSRAFAEKVGPSGKVFALDRDPHFVRRVGEEIAAANVEPVLADITAPGPIPDGTVDLIFISTVIHAFTRPQIQGFIGEARRMLKPLGLLAIVEMDKEDLPFGPPVSRKYSPEELKAIFPFHPLAAIRAGRHFYMQVFRSDPPA